MHTHTHIQSCICAHRQENEERLMEQKRERVQITSKSLHLYV